MYWAECENKFCIYYEDGKCTMDSICINSQGICDTCLQVDFDEGELNLKRAKLLDQLQRQYLKSMEHVEKRAKMLYPHTVDDDVNKTDG